MGPAPNRSSIPWWIKAGIGFVLAAILITGFLVSASYWAFLRPPPSDLDISARFQKHRQEFEFLAALAAADSELVAAYRDPILGFRVTIRDAGTRRRLAPADVRASYRSSYRRLLRQTGVRAMWRSSRSAVKFEVMANYDVRKGLVYSTERLTPLRPSLDGLVDDAGNGYLTVAYRPLAPRWYVFLEARE